MKTKTSVFIGAMATILTSSAIGAGSIRIGGGSMRAGSLKTIPEYEQSVSTTDTSRMALSKSSSSLSKKLSDVVRVKETQKPTTVKPVSETDVANLESRMADLQDALEKANDKLDSMYTKEELDARLPRYDKENNRLTWIDPLAGLINVPVGAVVIGGDNAVVVDGVLDATSVHPIQNKTVTNALNEKQDKSTTVSFGAANGRWTPLTNSNYLESYTNIDGTGFDIKQNMIVNNLDNIANGNQLVTATAVKNALDAMTTNPGGGTQQGYYYNLVNIDARSLVTQYTYQTNAPYNKIVEFTENMCEGTISEKWCDLRHYPSDERFVVTKRRVGYDLKDYNYWQLTQTQYSIVRLYSANIPDDVNPTTYAQENFCATRNTDYCYISDIVNNFATAGALETNAEVAPIYLIGVVSGFGTPPL